MHSYRAISNKESLAKQYGNKAANLIILDDLCKSLTSHLFKIQIPDLFPIDDKTISNHLNLHAKNWLELWNDFIKEQGSNKALSEKSINILKKLQALIINCFNTHPLKINTKLTESPDALLMVRSTGEEDTLEIANAGGNTSVAAVKPNVFAISSAIGVVIASYFSEKSLTQRLLSGGNIIKPPFMPVFLQKMIGEKAEEKNSHTEISISGVIYAEADRTLVDAAPGHGELVVTSQGPCDTFFVTQVGAVHAKKRHKTDRLAAAEIKELDGSVTNKLIYKKNPKVLQSAPALAPVIVREMANVCQIIKSHYKIPLDIEFIYSPQKKIFYIVQVRPIPVFKSLLTPSAIAPEQWVKIKNDKLHANVISSGGQVAKVITEKQQLLVAADIGSALKTFLSTEELRKETRAAVVKNLAPSTSHEAASFNSFGMPVLQADTEVVTTLLNKPKVALIVDPQHQHIVDISSEMKDIKNIDQEILDKKLIVDGLFSSTLSQKKTLLPIDSIPDCLKDIIKQYLESKEVVKKPFYTTLIQNLEILESAAPNAKNEHVFKALKSIAAFFKALGTSTNAKNRVLPHKKIFLHAMVSIAEIHYLLQYNYIEKSAHKTLLDLISQLKALVSNPGEPGLYSDSIMQLAAQNKFARKIENIESKQFILRNSYLIEFSKLSMLASNAQIEEAWLGFALYCSRSGDGLQLLSKIIFQYSQYNLLPEFINYCFAREVESKATNEKMLENLVIEFEKNIPLFEKLNGEENLHILESWEKRIPDWSIPDKFDSLHHALKLDFEKLNGRLTLDSKTPDLPKMLLLKQVQDLAEMLDKSIKSLKGSPEYKENQILLVVERFAKLLSIYNELMKKWLRAIPEAQYNYWAEKVEEEKGANKKDNMIKMFDDLFKIKSVKRDKAQLYPSGHINVAAVCVGTTASLHRQLNGQQDQKTDKITLEDLFSIMHQNILTSTVILNQAVQIKTENLPIELQKMMSKLDNHKSAGVHLLGIQYQHPKIVVSYNYPLKNHSAKITIEFNKINKKMLLHIKFFGRNWDNRMVNLATIVNLEAIFLNTHSGDKVVYNEKSLSLEFTWKVDKKNLGLIVYNFDAILKDYARMTNELNAFIRILLQAIDRYSSEMGRQFIALNKDELRRFFFGCSTQILLRCICKNEWIMQLLFTNEEIGKFIKQDDFYEHMGRINFESFMKLINVYHFKLDINFVKQGFRNILEHLLQWYGPYRFIEFLQLAKPDLASYTHYFDEFLYKENPPLVQALFDYGMSMSRINYRCIVHCSKDPAMESVITDAFNKMSEAEFSHAIAAFDVNDVSHFNSLIRLIKKYQNKLNINYRASAEEDSLFEKLLSLSMHYTGNKVIDYLLEFKIDYPNQLNAVSTAASKHCFDVADKLIAKGAPIKLTSQYFLLHSSRSSDQVDQAIIYLLKKKSSKAELTEEDLNALALHKSGINQLINDWSVETLSEWLNKKNSGLNKSAKSALNQLLVTRLSTRTVGLTSFAFFWPGLEEELMGSSSKDVQQKSPIHAGLHLFTSSPKTLGDKATPEPDKPKNSS